MKYFILFLIFMCFCFICHGINHFLSIFDVFLRFLSFYNRNGLLIYLYYFSFCVNFYLFGDFYRIYDLSNNFVEANNDYDNFYHLYLTLMIRTIFCNESSFSLVYISYTILNFPNPLLQFGRFFYYFSEYFLIIRFGILFRLYQS